MSEKRYRFNADNYHVLLKVWLRQRKYIDRHNAYEKYFCEQAGISQQTIHNYITGEQEPNRRHLERILNGFGLTWNDAPVLIRQNSQEELIRHIAKQVDKIANSEQQLSLKV